MPKKKRSNSDSGKPSDNEIYKAAWLNNTLQAFFLLDKSGRIIESNRMAERLVKEIAGKMLKEGENLSEYIFTKKNPDISKELQKAEKGKHLNGELKEQDVQGNFRWFIYSITPVMKSGKVTIISFGLIEITDQKISELELEERNKEQKCLYEIARLDEINLSTEQLIRQALDLLPEGFLYPELMESVITYKGKKYKTENYKSSDQKLTFVSGRASEHIVKIEIVSNKKSEETDVGFLNKEKELIEAVADLLSIKLYQVNTRQDIQLINERFEYALKASEDVIYDHNMVADTISISENFQNIFGYSFADEPFTFEKWVTLIHPDDEEDINSRLSKALADKDKSKWEAEFRHAKKDGSYANVKENAYIIRDDTGQPVRMIGTVRDITESKYRELKKELSSNISRIFNESDTLRVVLKKALYEVKALGKFKFAEIWLVNHDRSAIELTSYIEKNNEKFYKSEFDKDSFKKGKGLPGKTWKSGKVQFWKNLDSRKTFIRSKGAENSDLKSGYGFPVTYNNEVIGVLLLCTDKSHQKSLPFVGVLEELAEQLGEEIHRKKLEEELSRIFTSAPDGIIVAGFDGFLKKVNPAMSEILGYSEEELLNTPFIEFIHPDDKKRTLQFYEEANSGTEKSHFENRYISKSGQVVWLSWTFKVFLEEEVAYSVAKNITDQKKLEHLLEQGNKLAKIGPWEVDLIKNEIYWSDVIREILGVGSDVEPAMEKGLDLYKEGESRDKMSDAIQQAIEKGNSWDIEVQIVAGPANEKWVRSIGEAEFVDGKCVRLYGSLQDIHEKKELEELLEKANRLARIGSWEVDPVKEKVNWGGMTREIHEVGPDFEPELNTNIQFYKEGEHREKIIQAVTRAIEEGEPFDLELQIVTAKGNERWVRAIGEAELIDGKPVRIYGSFQDIHDMKVAETRLENIANNLPGVMFQYWLTPDGKDSVHYLSEGSVDVWGVSAADAMEDFDRVWANAHKDDVETIRDTIIESAESLNQWHFVWRFYHPDGSLRWQEGFGTPQKLADGTVVWDSIVLDITERKELEHLLEQSAKMASIGSWEVDLIEDQIYWSDTARELHETESDYKPVLESVINFYKEGKSRDTIREVINHTIETGEGWDLELQIVTAKGNERWIRTIGEADMADGKPVRIYGSYQDIHDRKIAEVELKEKTAHIDAIAQLNAALLNFQDWFDALERHLGVIGEAVDADRVYFFENRFDPDTGEGYASQKLEWCREGIKPQLGNPDLDEIPFSDVPELVDPMIDRKHSTRKISEVPKGSVTEYVMIDQQMKTFLAIPIYIKDHFHGFVGFDNCTIEKDWSDEEMTTLKTIASNLAIAIERQKADEELQSAFEEKNTILESIGDAFFALDQNWEITYWNRMAEKVLGIPREKILGENLWDLYENATSLEFYTQYHKAVNEQVTVHFEEFYSALEKWFEVSAYPSESGLSVFFKDVTDRKEAQKQLIEKTSQLDAIAMFNSLLIKEDSWKDALEKSFPVFGELVNCDRVYYFNNVSGLEGEQTISMTQEWVKEGIAPQIDNPVHQNLPHTEIWDFIEPLISRKPFNHAVKDFENKEFRKLLEQQDIKSLLALPVFTGSEFQGFIGFDDCTTGRSWREEEILFLKTITINLGSAIENEDAEEALQKAFKEKNEILESIDDGFFAVDHNFTVTYWNSKAEELLFTPKEKIIDKNLWSVFDKEQANESYRQYSRVLKERKALKFEDFYEPIDRWFDVNVYPSLNGISVFFKDITERKKADEKLKELNKALEQQAKELAASNAELEQFAFVASHDLQEPLRMITGFLAQIEKKYEDVLDEKGKKYIHFATDGAKRMRQIILDLLEFSRVGRVDTQREEIDMNDLIQEALSLNKKLIAEQKADIKVEILPVIKASKGPMRQLFQNLINNAVKYHKQDSSPEVNITSREDEEFWHFEIKDNGIGIGQEYSDKIFNIFQRLHGKEEFSGSGVGLAICKKIVEDHGGKIRVESEPGKGSTFYFSIAKEQRVFENEN